MRVWCGLVMSSPGCLCLVSLDHISFLERCVLASDFDVDGGSDTATFCSECVLFLCVDSESVGVLAFWSHQCVCDVYWYAIIQLDCHIGVVVSIN